MVRPYLTHQGRVACFVHEWFRSRRELSMAFYARYVVPRIIDVVLRNPESTRLRSSWIPRATGNFLEVGLGSGLTLPFHSLEVRCVFSVHPSIELQSLARQ